MNKNCKPKTILFDAGGVLIDVKLRQEGFLDVARIVNTLLIRSSGTCLGEKRILIDLETTAATYSSWKFAQSRRAGPRSNGGCFDRAEDHQGGWFENRDSKQCFGWRFDSVLYV